LALSWHAVDDTTWEFKLRPNVHFSDGSPFTARDVAASLERAAGLQNSIGGYGMYTRQVTRAEIVDDHTIRLHTAAPYPAMPFDLSPVWIVSHKVAREPTEAFNAGKAVLGTGPFRLVEWVRGERLVLERNDNYWGRKPAWKRVVMRFVPNDSARIAALLAGDVDFIEMVPPSAFETIKSNPALRLVTGVSARVIYLTLDSYREQTPFAFDARGNPLPGNPLRDRRVRLAISKAIDRQAIVERIMQGVAEPAGQLVPGAYFGASTKLRPEPADPEGARALLAAAGYPSGFAITLQVSNDRYINAEKVAIAIGQMLARVGIDTRVDAMPESIYKSRASKFEFSFFVQGWYSESAEASNSLRAIVATRDDARGWGTANRGRYSNPDFDQLLRRAVGTAEDGARSALLAEAMEMAMEDAAVVPLYLDGSTWACRRDLAYVPRLDQFTLAQEVTRAP
ncbi:MAG TPA: ABC transporter substrate-binding protein, partial [Stellaceae bacterium]|nr:ABC transporter substrate-binding protein [Stellaceae bacterium]